MRSVVIPCAHLNEEKALGLISLLHDMQKFATLQTAKSNVATAIAALSSPMLRAKATELFERLKKASRVLDCKALGGPCADNCLCPMELSAATFVADDGCGVATGAKTFSLSNYVLAGPHELLSQADFSNYSISTAEEWEAKVLRPLFQFAKVLYMVDYIAGQNLNEFHGSLEWVIAAFRKTASTGPVTLFTNVRNLDEQRKVAAWGKRMSVKPVFRRYNPSRSDSLPHDRFLITQSTGLQIGRGLNLLFGDQVRSSSLHLVENTGDVLNVCFASGAAF